MIGYIKGTVSHIYPEYCLIDVQGIGYRIFIPSSTREKLMVGKTISLFTHLNVREDALLLYGFYSEDEYELFGQLMSVAGIGPKVAVNILSDISPLAFKKAVMNKDINALTKISGIGKKTAERLVLELKDKLGLLDNSEEPSNGEFMADNNDIITQSVQALVSLGYSQPEVLPVVKKACLSASTIEDVIKLALKEFARR